MNQATAHAPSYRHVAPVYDLLASAYSLGAIDRAKRLHHGLIQAGDRVLYVGAGRGREIVDACASGAEVTCVEPCPAMASRLHKHLSGVADRFTVAPRPIQSIPTRPEYDLVVAHFFLNVFSPAAMPEVLSHTTGFVKPGGRMVIADFMPAASNAGFGGRAVRSLYYRPVNLAGWALRICALHPIYDYGPLLHERGFEIQRREAFRIAPMLTALYETIVSERSELPPSCDGG